ADVDGDGFGDPAVSESACAEAPGFRDGPWSVEAGDCDDDDPLVRPGGLEACDGRDNDCQGGVDDVDGVATTPGEVHATVEDGVIAALDEEVPLSLCAGVHEVPRVLVRAGESLVVRGVGTSVTTLRGPPDGLFEVEGGTLTVARLTLTAPGGPVIEASSLAQIDVTDCVVDGSKVGLQLTGTTDAAVRGTVIRDNGAGGLDDGGVSVSQSATLLVTGGEIVGNRGVDGGGLTVRGGQVNVVGTVVRDNEATRGGGAYVERGAGLVLQEAQLVGNRAVDGGGVWVDGMVDLLSTEVTDHLATVGAGFFLTGGVVAVDGASVVKRNVASSRSGAAHLTGGRLAIDGADFGSGADDNEPQDIQSDDGTVDSALGAVAFAECSNEGCSAP
ncbi:MAG: MopE-related protein, partial [Myxococcota bacterium]